MFDTVVMNVGGAPRICVKPSAYAALLRLLISRATLLDRYRAIRKPGHWLHKARIELALTEEEG